MAQTQTPPPADDPHPVHDPQAVDVTPSGISAHELYRRKRMRNLVLALALGAFVVLVFVITVVKLGAGVLDRPL